MRCAFSAQATGHHAGWRDDIGRHFRPDARKVAVWAAFEWDGLAGYCVARLARNIGEPGDALRKYRQYADVVWSMNYAMLLRLASEDELAQLLPADVLVLMQQYPEKIFVDTNWASREEWELVSDDARIVPIVRGADEQLDTTE